MYNILLFRFYILLHFLQSKQILVEHLKILYNGRDKFENKRLILEAFVDIELGTTVHGSTNITTLFRVNLMYSFYFVRFLRTNYNISNPL